MFSLSNLIDCHTHTRFSVDSDADIRAMIDRAIQLGLKAYAVTDHCECNRWFSEEHYKDIEVYKYFDFGKDFENSVSAITSLKKEYEGKINLICGSELGQAEQEPEIAQKVVDDPRVDFIIGSMHQLPDEEDFALMDYSHRTTDEIYDLLDRYFKEIYKLCKWGKFDILGHLTYTLRYIEGDYGFDIDVSRFDDVIAESLRLVAQNGKGIEINTSGLRQKYGRTFPELKYVKLFKDLGGEILSLGSDAHFVEHLGGGIAQGAQIAFDAGFTQIAYFKNHKPVFIHL